ncbi:hypothetical protein J6590_044264 [Homalodisca vitripennis]|nr:hypothetical protein J6590_044264 [Homalodisca vitripennis]
MSTVIRSRAGWLERGGSLRVESRASRLNAVGPEHAILQECSAKFGGVRFLAL